MTAGNRPPGGANINIPARYNILGAEITPLTESELLAVIAEAVDDGRRCIVAHHNLHSLYLSQRDPKFREFFTQARLAHVDGMSLILMGRLLGHPVSREHRVTYVELISPLMSHAEDSRWRVFFLGGRPGVGGKASAIFKSKYPMLNIKAHHGYFDVFPDSEGSLEAVSLINSFRPHLLLVGMGMPRQEHWILDNLDRLNAGVVLPVGACMDYVAGVVPTPPRWMGNAGLEWLFRLASEPRRLWRRYIAEPWLVFYLLLKRICER